MNDHNLLGKPETGFKDVAFGVESRGVEDAVAKSRRARAGGAHRHRASLELGDVGNARIFERDEMCVARIEHSKRAQRDGAELLEVVAGEDSILRGVGHREGEIRGALLQELEVVDRCRRHFGRGFDVRQTLGDYFGDAAAVRVVHAAGAARGNRQTARAAGVWAAGRACREREDDGPRGDPV